MTEEVKQDPREYWKDFPEAPFSTTFKWIDANGFEQMTTVRGWTFSSMFKAVGLAEEIISDHKGLPINNKPITAPITTIPMIDENGTPVIDGNTGQPQQTALPDGTKLYTVSGLAHDKTKSGKDVLKVWTVEEPYNKGYGVSCFHPPALVGEWKSWPVMSKENKTRYAPPAGMTKVIIKDAQGEGTYPDVKEFR